MAAPLTHDEAVRRLRAVGRRAWKAVKVAERRDPPGGLKRWLYTAGAALATGDRSFGVARPWPGLAAQVRNIAAGLEA